MKRKSKYALDLEKIIIDLCSDALDIVGENDDEDLIKNKFRKKCRCMTWKVKSNYPSTKES